MGRPRCRHVFAWPTGWPDNRCTRRTLGWFCVEHWLDRLRWERRGRWMTARVDLSNINRPYVQIDEDRPCSYVSVSYGNGNSDPVLSLEVHRQDPETAR